ncbi:MAG: hypothetical protein ACI9U2_002572 [Bradymonadia bacterium]
MTRAADADLGKMLASAVAAQEARWARSLVRRALAAQTPARHVRFAVAAVLMRNASPDTISRARRILEARVDPRDVTILRAGLR